MSSILYYFLGEAVDEDIDELTKEESVKIHVDYLFCTEDERKSLENKYDIKFYPCELGLFDLICDDFNIDNVLDCDLMFQTDIQSDNKKALFISNFEAWLNHWKDVFLENMKYISENYQDCESNYFNLLAIA